MKGFIVIARKIIATRIIRTISETKTGVQIETDDKYIMVTPGNGDVSGAMNYMISTFNCRDE